MAGLPEDLRVAVGFSVTLSGQLVQAAVTLLTVQGAYVAYALASRDTKCGFEVAAGLAFLVFIFSIYFSGKGVTAARNAGFLGAWDLNAGKSYFNLQASLLLAGVVLLIVMIFLSGNSKESDVAKKLEAMSLASSSLDSKIAALSRRLEEGKTVNTQSLETLRLEVNSLRDSVTALSQSIAEERTAKATKVQP